MHARVVEGAQARVEVRIGPGGDQLRIADRVGPGRVRHVDGVADRRHLAVGSGLALVGIAPDDVVDLLLAARRRRPASP